MVKHDVSPFSNHYWRGAEDGVSNMPREFTRDSNITRRTFMKGTGAGGLIGLAGAEQAVASEHQDGNNQPPSQLFADLAFLNGKILTMDDDDPDNISIADAVAIRDGRFLSVGCNGDVQRWIGPDTQRINLNGRSVIPGLIDTHSHLQGYSLHHRGEEFVPELGLTDISGEEWDEVKENTLETVRQEANQADAGRWILVDLPYNMKDPEGNPISAAAALQAPWGVLPSGTKEPVVTRDELDEVAPDNPVYVEGPAKALFNTQAIEIIKSYFGELGPRVHSETGSSGVLLARAVLSDIIVPDLETLAELYRLESEEWTQYGVTTWASSFQGTRPLQAYALLDSRDQMPHRLAFSHAVGITSSWSGPAFYRRYALPTQLFNSQRMWQIGTSTINVDSSPPRVETSFDPAEDPISEATKSMEFSWIDGEGIQGEGDYLRNVIKSQLRGGHRLIGNHVGGDKTLDRYMNLIEEVAEEEEMSLDEVRAKRHGADHFRIYPRPDQIPRLSKLGIIASVGPKYIGRPDLIDLYGEEAVETMQVPTKDLIEGGVTTAWEIDTHSIADRPGHAFWYLEKLVTREMDGRVFGAHNRVDRLTALLTATRWAAEYVLAEDELGSIEEGKLADFVVLEKDFLEVPKDKIHTVDPDLVVVGGDKTIRVV